MSNLKSKLIEQLIITTEELARKGMTPATSSNFSARLDEHRCVITVSGRDKGKLTEDDFMEIDMHGNALEPDRCASAETLLHTQIYNLRPAANVVLHTHSLAQTLLSMHHAQAGEIKFNGYELQKAFDGIKSHNTAVSLPIVANSQDMPALSEATTPLFARKDFWGYLIAGHGIYTWGRSILEARRHLDAFEFLLNAELAKMGFKA